MVELPDDAIEAAIQAVRAAPDDTNFTIADVVAVAVRAAEPVIAARVHAEALSGAASVGAMAVANRAVEDAPDDAILTVRDVVRVAVVAASPVVRAEAVADALRIVHGTRVRADMGSRAHAYFDALSEAEAALAGLLESTCGDGPAGTDRIAEAVAGEGVLLAIPRRTDSAGPDHDGIVEAAAFDAGISFAVSSLLAAEQPTTCEHGRTVAHYHGDDGDPGNYQYCNPGAGFRPAEQPGER